jgi:YfiH family protein
MSQPAWISSPLLTSAHAFFTRHGGISEAPYDSLNFGGHEDDPQHIAENRALALRAVGMNPENVAFMKQVHGNEVRRAVAGPQTCDALVTNEKGLALAVSTADCYPLLFEDANAGVIGAAHAGWRGTLARIAKSVVEEMIALGASASTIRAAIGPGICGKNYEVSEDVIAQFREAGFPETCFDGRLLNLAEGNRFVAAESGVLTQNIWISGRCSTEDDFFSYRRDHGKTGRMWSVIMR